MTLNITHTKTASGSNKVVDTDWNASHTITGGTPITELDIINDLFLGEKYHYIHDEFAGEALSELWTTNTVGSGDVNASTHYDTCGTWLVTTADPPSANDYMCMYTKQHEIWDLDDTHMTMRVALGPLATSRQCMGVCNPHGDTAYSWFIPGTTLNNAIFFEYNSTVGNNWLARVIDGSTDWTADTGVTAVYDQLINLRIDRVSSTSLQFKINGSLVATYTTPLVNNNLTSAAFYIQALSTTHRWLAFDYINYIRPLQ